VRGLVTCNHVRVGGYLLRMLRGSTTTLCRSWREGVLRLVAWCVCGLRAVCCCAVPSAARFALDFRWKDSFSGRTELDLGRVCGVWMVLKPEMCCVVLTKIASCSASAGLLKRGSKFIFLYWRDGEQILGYGDDCGGCLRCLR
jgi:hypothetical protein